MAAVKYLYKYVYKGSDRAVVEVGTDEIQRYLDGRYFSAQEACWRLLDFEIHAKSPGVIRLHVHLEGDQVVHFRDADIVADIAERPGKETTLTAWFKANSAYPDAAKGIKYHDFPNHFVWSATLRVWTPRRTSKYSAVGRMYAASPMEGERYYLRLLLTEMTGCTSFADLKTLPDGTVCETYRESAAARGLLMGDREHYHAFFEAASHASPRALSRLFAALLAYCSPGSPRDMWDAFLPYLAEGESGASVAEAISQLDADLRSIGSSISSFPSIPQLDIAAMARRKVVPIQDFPPAPEAEYASSHIPMLNEEQANAFESITSDVFSGTQRAHFVEGPGGSGKTFFYNVLLAEIRGKGLGAAAVASSGIAALLLRGGRTAHATLKLPIRASVESICAAQKGSAHAEYLGSLSLIIWEEAPMAHRHLAECLDRPRRDIRSDESPFGGVLVVFGGYFRQIPPVVRHGSRAQIVSASLNRSPLRSTINRHQLRTHLRLCQGEGEFSSYLIKIGDGAQRSPKAKLQLNYFQISARTPRGFPTRSQR